MRTTVIIMLVGLAVVLGSCGSDDSTTTPDGTETSVDSSAVDEPTTSQSTTSTTPSSTTSSSTSTSTTTTLPGEEFDGFPKDGDVIAVVGVSHDDQLNIRAAPGTDQAILGTSAPTADDLTATGRARRLSASIWYEVTTRDTTGWVSSRFVAFVGETDDATAEFLSERDRPEAETLSELGELVAAEYASTDPESSIVQTVAPSVGDLGEVTYDVIGIGDDAVAGYRLHLFATVGESDEGFVLRTIERTTFCSRGLSNGLCP